MNVLFTSDLAFTNPILTCAGSQSSCAARHSERRLQGFTPLRQIRGVRQWEDLERWSWVTGKIHWYATSSECHETKWPHPSPYWKRSKPSRDGDKRDSLSFSLTAIPPLFTFLLLRFLPWKFHGSRLWQAGTVVKKGGVGYLSMEVSDQCLIKPQ